MVNKWGRLLDELERNKKIKEDENIKSLFTKEEVKKIIMNTVQGMGESSKDEIDAVYEWCHLQRTGYHLVQLLIDGMVLVKEIKDGEPIFIYALTEDI